MPTQSFSIGQKWYWDVTKVSGVSHVYGRGNTFMRLPFSIPRTIIFSESL